MKNIVLFFTLFLSLSCKPSKPKFEDGDIIFQTSKSSQSQILKIVTKSQLTHCGIIFIKNGKYFVFEAVQPVKVTPLENWISRGENSKYKVTRLKYVLTESSKKDMFNYAKKQLGKNYDLKFEWSESKMYCSELVWKIYNSAGYTLSTPKKFSNYDLSNESTKKLIKQRYGDKFNLNGTVVSPNDLYLSTITEEIYSNY